MTEHLDSSSHPDLVGLLRGELSNREILLAGEHLECCQTCRADLGERVVGHSLMARSAHAHQRRQPIPGSLTPPAMDLLPLPDLPDLPPPTRGRRRSSGRLTLLVAGLALAVGTGLAGAWVLDRPDAGRETLSARPVPQASEPGQVLASANLAPLQSDHGGTAQVIRPSVSQGQGFREVRVDLDVAPTVSRAEFVEVWLLDPATQKMLPLGVVDGTGGTFRVRTELLDSYRAVDLSLETDDGDPRHSSVSLMRGVYRS